jgi:3-isopropylmalate/(R)-2-methylmalate dehydratase small subunit
MQPFKILTDIAAPIDMDNVDTDQLIPARLMRTQRANGNYAKLLYHDARFDDDGQENPDFILNQEPFRQARIFVAGRNYGCGSSRLGAVYVHLDFGVRAIIAHGFGEVFFNNCFKNGILPIRLDIETCDHIRRVLHAKAGAAITVDLPAQKVTGPDGTVYEFSVDPFGKRCLLEGIDDITLTLGYEDKIKAFEHEYHRQFDWLEAQQ